MPDSKKKNSAPPPVFTRDELLIISNALNEICNGLPFKDEEFQTRIGFSRETARKVLEKVGKSLST